MFFPCFWVIVERFGLRGVILKPYYAQTSAFPCRKRTTDPPRPPRDFHVCRGHPPGVLSVPTGALARQPSQLLLRLDKAIFSLLQQQMEATAWGRSDRCIDAAGTPK